MRRRFENAAMANRLVVGPLEEIDFYIRILEITNAVDVEGIVEVDECTVHS